MDPRTTVTESGYIKSRFLDDKLSAAILLGLARAVAAGEVTLSRKVSLLFTVYEEVGHGGAFVPADTREMISVDMGCVGDDLGCTERMVSICAKDSGGPYNYDLVTTLSNIARELERSTTRSMCTRTTAPTSRQRFRLATTFVTA